ncbi:hypothetical protein [Cyclobacterium plantarum]|uniref:hypothetical protein n=1 Tax=Cyclobacterium plantarum TaxID=2716263 RepID=UPI003F6F1D34
MIRSLLSLQLFVLCFIFSWTCQPLKAQDTLSSDSLQAMIDAPTQFTQVPYFTFGKGLGLMAKGQTLQGIILFGGFRWN